MLEKVKTRDVKAPRFRMSKYRYTVLNKDLYKNYCKASKRDISYSLFKNIIEDYNSEICEEVVANRNGVKLPAMMGIMALCSFKPRKKVPLNWGQIETHGLKIKDLNLETNELVCKIVYSVYSSKYRFKNFHIWRFEGYRGFKTKVSKAFRLNYNIYKRMDNKSRVSKMFNDDYIAVNFGRKRDEQGVDSGQQNNG